MTKILDECDVTLTNLATVLDDAGISADQSSPHWLALETPAGLRFRLLLDETRKFIALRTYLPISKELDNHLELANRMNSEVFLASFNVDSDGDIAVEYLICYERGLIVPQFLRLVRRFYGTLDHVLRKFESEDVFAFSSVAEVAEPPRPSILQ